MEEKKELQYSLIAGILIIAAAFFDLFPFYFNVWVALRLVGFAAIAFALLTKRRDFILPAGIAVVAILAIISFIQGFGYHYYDVYNYYWNMRFNFFCMLPAFFEMIGLIAAALLAFVAVTDYVPQYKEKVTKLWFIPAGCIILKSVIGFIVWLIINVISSNLWFLSAAVVSVTSIISNILLALGILFMSVWAVFPNGLDELKIPKINKQAEPAAAENAPASGAAIPAAAPAKTAASGEMYCALVKHVLLLFFTFGIWLLIWIYRATGYTNACQGEEYRNPGKKLLLCMFIPFYQIYWIYKTSLRIDKMARARGVASDLSTLCLILAIFVPVIPPILMQDKINAIISGPKTAAAAAPKATVNETVVSEPVVYEAAKEPVAPVVKETVVKETPQESANIAEELKTYKELLDSGIITQEDYDSKKKQILGL